MNIASPCIHVCKLDGRNVCTGCHRTRDEIARWTVMSEGERARVMARVNGKTNMWRMGNNGVGRPQMGGGA